MNKDNAKHFLPLVQALAEGKTLQYMPKGEDIGTTKFPRNVWTDLDFVYFQSSPDRYRVKREPFTARVLINRDNGAMQPLNSAWLPINIKHYTDAGWELITVVEKEN